MKRQSKRFTRDSMRYGIVSFSIALFLLLVSSSFVSPIYAAAIDVEDGAVLVNNDGVCSLREALVNAHNNAQTYTDCAAGSGADTINLPNGGNFVFTDEYLSTNSALPDLNSEIIIEGNGATLSRGNTTEKFRLLRVYGLGNITLNRLTLSGGNIVGLGGAIRNYGGRLTLNACTVTNNMTDGGFSSSADGGGIANSGTLTINHSTIANNYATGILNARGGGIFNQDGTATINHSTIVGNQAAEDGGGLYIHIFNETATLTLNYSLVSGNVDTTPGSAAHEIYYSSGTINANNNNLFGHSGENNNDAYTGFTPGGNDINATSDGSTPTALDAILDTGTGSTPWLTDNGGGIQTVALVNNSPAIDVIANTSCVTPDDVDQRGAGRNFDGDSTPSSNECDIGAYEYRAPETQNIGSTGTFSFDTHNVTVTITTLGDLITLTVESMDTHHPLATGTAGSSGIQTGKWWHIVGLDNDGNEAAGVTFSLTLPHTGVANPKVCKYPGGQGGYGWDCAADTANDNKVTRNGLTSFSDWAVGSNTGPTAVVTQQVKGKSYTLFSITWIVVSMLLITYLILKRRLSTS